MLIWASKFGTAETSVASKWASKDLWGVTFILVLMELFLLHSSLCTQI